MQKPDDVPATPIGGINHPPAVDYPWQQTLRPVLVLISAGMLVVAATALVVSLRSWEQGDEGGTAGFAGGAIALLILGVICLQDAGIRHIRLPRSITRVHHLDHGRGVRIPKRKVTIPLLLTILIGITVYSLAACIGWFTGIGETLLPFGRSTRESAIYMAVCGAVTGATAVLFLTVRFDTVVSIYTKGVERCTRRRFLFRVEESNLFLPWSEITGVTAGDLGVRIGSTQHPVVDLQTRRPVPADRRTRHDSENKIALMAHMLVAEPNTFFVLLKELAADPGRRDFLARPDAVELLRPPPLLERFRAARAQKPAR